MYNQTEEKSPYIKSNDSNLVLGKQNNLPFNYFYLYVIGFSLFLICKFALVLLL